MSRHTSGHIPQNQDWFADAHRVSSWIFVFNFWTRFRRARFRVAVSDHFLTRTHLPVGGWCLWMHFYLRNVWHGCCHPCLFEGRARRVASEETRGLLLFCLLQCFRARWLNQNPAVLPTMQRTAATRRVRRCTSEKIAFRTLMPTEDESESNRRRALLKPTGRNGSVSCSTSSKAGRCAPGKESHGPSQVLEPRIRPSPAELVQSHQAGAAHNREDVSKAVAKDACTAACTESKFYAS